MLLDQDIYVHAGKSPYHGFLEIDPLSPRMTLPRRFDIYSGIITYIT